VTRAAIVRRLWSVTTVAAAAACTTIRVEPEPARDLPLPVPRVPALAFDLHVAEDPRLTNPGIDTTWVRELDGEDLAMATEPIVHALRETGAFGGVIRRKPGDALHCDLHLRRHACGPSGGGFLLLLSSGVFPEFRSVYYELAARVTAPGKEPRSYRATCHAEDCLCVLLLPVGLVQGLTQRTALQQTVDAVVLQMAADGWLDG
jgi:hypothetical protein